MGVTTHSYQFTLTKGGIVPEKTMYARVFEFGGRHYIMIEGATPAEIAADPELQERLRELTISMLGQANKYGLMPTNKREAAVEWSDKQLKKHKIDKARLLNLMLTLRTAFEELEAMGLYGYVVGGGMNIMIDPKPERENSIAFVGGRLDGGDW